MLQKFTRLAGSYTYTDRQRSIFFQQLALILESGLALLKGLALLEQGSAEKSLAKLSGRLLALLRRGLPLATAMAAEPKFFRELAVALTAAGERSGNLAAILRELACYYERQAVWRGRLQQALLYPFFLLLLALAVMLFFLLYVLPVLGQAYTALGAEPSGLLLRALNWGTFLRENTLTVTLSVLAILSILVACRQYLLTLLWRLPHVRTLRQMLLEVRFCRLLSLLLASGVTASEAIPLAARALTDADNKLKAQHFAQALSRGMEFGQAALLAGTLLAPLTRELVRVGAASGALPQMLEQAASLREQELEQKMQRSRELLTPLLLIVAAAVIAVVLCSILGPLFDLFTILPD